MLPRGYGLGPNLCREVRQWHVQVGTTELARPVVESLYSSSGSGAVCHKGSINVTQSAGQTIGGQAGSESVQTASVEGQKAFRGHSMTRLTAGVATYPRDMTCVHMAGGLLQACLQLHRA